ncbi:MAG: sulfatase [Saprospiraceae bacterium]|nr:sulfatase [Saprospiraceae bacterium]
MTSSRFLAIALAVGLWLGIGACQESSSADSPPNVLFIAIDDLRTELACYGKPVHSPNLDRIAQEGFLFQNHFVNVPTCGASRYALLTGMLPQTKQHLSNRAMYEFMAEKAETEKPESFVHELRRNNYYTVGIGKISHSVDGLVYEYREPPSKIKEMPHSWDEFLFNAGKWKTGWNAFFAYADGTNRNDMEKQVKPYEAADVPDDGYPDGLTTQLALNQLQQLKERKQPFFLGVGYFKPHLPFNAPKKYWDLYQEKDLPISPEPEIPEGIDRASLHGSGEFNQYILGEEKASLDSSMSVAYQRKLKHAYYAGISYIDAQVGQLLAELERLELAENTIIVVWGDHGWHLGDQRVWGKHTLFERALKSTFMLKIPDLKGKAKTVKEVVSTIDLYPTLMDLCGIDSPPSTDGDNLLPLLQGDSPSFWRNTAYSYYRNGISLRTPRYRLTKYFREAEPVVELYDHQADSLERVNIADGNAELLQELLPVWDKGNTGLYAPKEE